MLEALKQRLKDVQEFDAPMDDASIAIATAQRQHVKAGQRRTSRGRRDRREQMKLAGASNKEIRETIGKRRKGSGISIDAEPVGREVVLTASEQVQHLRREQGETPDLFEEFRQYFPVAEKLRAARGL